MTITNEEFKQLTLTSVGYAPTNETRKTLNVHHACVPGGWLREGVWDGDYFHWVCSCGDAQFASVETMRQWHKSAVRK